MKTKSAAILTIHDAANMTPKGRRDIVKWINRQSRMIAEHDLKLLSRRFTARYLYPAK